MYTALLLLLLLFIILLLLQHRPFVNYIHNRDERSLLSSKLAVTK